MTLSAIDEEDFYSEIRKKNDLISTHSTDSIEDQNKNKNGNDNKNENDYDNENGSQRWVAMVNKIYPTSPAERAGLHVGGTVIIEFVLISISIIFILLNRSWKKIHIVSVLLAFTSASKKIFNLHFH